MNDTLISSSFSSFKQLEVLISDKYKYCCFARRYSDMKYCSPKRKKLHDCKNLITQLGARSLPNLILLKLIIEKIMFSAVLYTSATIGTILNSMSIFMKLKTMSNFSQIFEIILSLSDLLMCIYLAIISIQNYKLSGSYIDNDEKWRSSILCTSAGVICSTSCLMCVLSLLFITLEKYIVITYNIHMKYLSVKALIGILLLITSISVGLSTLPIFIFDVSQYYYILYYLNNT